MRYEHYFILCLDILLMKWLHKNIRLLYFNVKLDLKKILKQNKYKIMCTLCE